MKVIIKETGKTEELSLINPESGENHATEFVNIDDFEKIEDNYYCSQETFDWWEKVCRENEELEERIRNLIQIHDRSAVHDIVHSIDNSRIEDKASLVNQALTERFGEQQ